MRLVFHVGMGKTGTSSIQRTLAANEETLANQKARYLGMWFQMVAPRFHGHEGLHTFARETPPDQKSHAHAFLQACQAEHDQSGTTLFIHSNEGLFGHGLRLEPFFRTLMEGADVQFVVYVRPPRDWLPSAFTQWNIHHKQQKGRIQPFAERAKVLIGQYDGVRHWLDRFSDELTVRRFDKSVNIVDDFARVVGITLAATERRFLERGEPAELILRALFNDRFDAPIMPDRFDKQVINTHRDLVKDLQSVADLCFNYDGIDALIEERRRVFSDIENRTGIRLLDGDDGGAAAPSMDEIRARLFDYVLSITVEQSLRINRLEARLNALEARLPEPEPAVAPAAKTAS